MRIKLAVDRSRNRVLFADVGSDFVNVLLSFLTLPLTAVQFCSQGDPSDRPIRARKIPVRLHDDGGDEPLNVQGLGCLSNLCKSVNDEEDEEDALPNVKVGCLSNLCNNVSRLQKSGLLKVAACRGMLLTPFHNHEFKSCEIECELYTRSLGNLKPHGYGRRGWYLRCWLVMARLAHVYETQASPFGTGETFVRRNEHFIISDDWMIKPASTTSMQSLSQTLVPDVMVHDFEEVQVCLGWKEVQVMFKASLTSDTIFTDLFLSKEVNHPAAPLTVKPSTHQEPVHQLSEHTGSLPEICKIKLFFDRQERKVMYAECKHELLDLILGFLTYPLGCLIKNMGASHLGRGLDNLYSSAADLDAAGLMAGKFPREALLDPSLAPFNMGSCISEGASRENKELYMGMVPYSWCDSAADIACRHCHRDLVKDRNYVVTDDLRVHQASAMRVTKYWCRRDKANVVEMDITVGRQEAVALLRAVLTSETALTDVFIGRLEEELPAATKSVAPKEAISGADLFRSSTKD